MDALSKQQQEKWANDSPPIKNLMDGLLEEMNRVRELQKDYEDVGAPGAFALVMMKQSIIKAEASIKENDVEKMIVAYGDLKAYES